MFASQNYQIIPMHDFSARHLALLNFRRRKLCYPPRELGAVEITDAHNVPCGKRSLAPQDAGRQEAFATVTQGLLRRSEERRVGKECRL